MFSPITLMYPPLIYTLKATLTSSSVIGLYLMEDDPYDYQIYWITDINHISSVCFMNC